MSRLLLLLIFMLWMGQPLPPRLPAHFDPLRSTLPLLTGYLALIAVLGFWARRLTHRITDANFHTSLRRFNRSMDIARVLIPLWLGVGLFLLNWKLVVYYCLPKALWPYETPAALLGTLPPFLAWMGLWWSQFPADRALREQNLLIQLDNALPIHAPPGFRSYFSANLRLQLLFTIVPVLLILLTRDLAGLALQPFLPQLSPTVATVVEGTVMFGAAALIFLLAPEILRHVLHTVSLPPSPLRDRLDAMCRRHNLRYRDVLLWHTQGNMGNAAVMGVLPQVRYVLLSDLLIETMTDEQIEAVFAHELGHIVHRHMLWYVLFVVILMLTLAGPMTTLENLLPKSLEGDPATALSLLTSALLFFVTFGYVSRRFERQADVFAARTLESPSSQQATSNTPQAAPVHAHGATLFSSALHRVAVINNIPVASRSWWHTWSHDSIASRMAYLHTLAPDPAHTRRFDTTMRRLYWVLIAALLLTAAWTLHVTLTTA